MPSILRASLVSLFLVLVPMLHGSAMAGAAFDRVVQRGTLVLGTSGNMPSMSMRAADGSASGFDVDLARLMADMMGVKLQVRVLPFAELIGALRSGEVDVVISNVTITPQRNLRVAFVGPYLTSGKCFVTKNEALAAGDGSKDLNSPGTRLTVLAGSTSEAFARELFPNATLLPVADYDAATDMVRNDSALGLLTDFPICLAALKNHPEAGFVSVFSRLTYEPIGIALPPDDAQFINWTENFLERLHETNAIEQLAGRWFGRAKLIQQ